MTQEQMTAQNIQEKIAIEFGFEDLDDAKQKSLIEHMTESVIKRVLVEAYVKLSDSDKEQFEEKIGDVENIDPSEIEVFLMDKLGDEYNVIVNDTVADLKKHIMENTDE